MGNDAHMVGTQGEATVMASERAVKRVQDPRSRGQGRCAAGGACAGGAELIALLGDDLLRPDGGGSSPAGTVPATRREGARHRMTEWAAAAGGGVSGGRSGAGELRCGVISSGRVAIDASSSWYFSSRSSHEPSGACANGLFARFRLALVVGIIGGEFCGVGESTGRWYITRMSILVGLPKHSTFRARLG